MRKPAAVQHDIHPLLRERFSPLAFDGSALAEGALRQLLEAARWAASSFNEQPWRFIVAPRQDTQAFNDMLACLAEGNQTWACNAGALIITVARTSFSRNGKANRHAWHDMGLAMGALSMQAQALGLSLHQMAGFNADAARATYQIPEGFEPVTAVAIGNQGDLNVLPDNMHQRALAPRNRWPQSQMVFTKTWGKPADLDGEQGYEQLLSFWFDELDEQGLPAEEVAARWWKKSAAFDQELRDRFGALHQAVLDGKHDGWLTSARGRLAYVIVLDQLSRNLYRDTPKMYEADERAQAVAQQAVELSLDISLQTVERVFLYMPFMHAEATDTQHRCVALMSGLAESLSGEAQAFVRNNVSYAEQHRDIVVRWGRFPHRNDILGRETTEEEAAFLKEPNSSF